VRPDAVPDKKQENQRPIKKFKMRSVKDTDKPYQKVNGPEEKDYPKRNKLNRDFKPFGAKKKDSPFKKSAFHKDSKPFRNKDNERGSTSVRGNQTRNPKIERREESKPARKTSDGKAWIPFEERTFRKPSLPRQDNPNVVKRPRKKRPDQEENKD
jgi:hypothetical protein